MYNICMNLIKKCLEWVKQDAETMLTGFAAVAGVIILIVFVVQEWN